MAPAINEFKRLDGSIDVNAWRYDIIARLLTDMDNGGSGLSTRELCMLYFGYADLEKIIWVRDQMQAVRQMVQDRPTPLLLRNNQYRWYIVNPTDAGAARGFIQERAKRFIRSHTRLITYSEIGQATYSLAGDDPLLTAIEGVSPNVRQLDSALALPEPDDTE